MADEATNTEEAVPVDETVAPDPTPAPEPEVVSPSGPWADALNEKFPDPAQRAAVDEFLRGDIQPYITKLEQATATDRNAQRLWDDFTQNPNETFFSVAEELYGEDVAAKFKDAMTAVDNVESGTDPSDPYSADLDITMDELPPAVRQVVEEYQEAKQQENWNKLVEQVQSDNQDIKIKSELFAPFVNATDGDVDAAVGAYREYIANLKSEYGIDDPAPADPADAAPPTIGRESGSQTTPPVDTTPETIDQAIDEMWADMQAAKAPATLPG